MSNKLCKFYRNGYCRNGSNCKFIHSDDNKCKCNLCVKNGQNPMHKRSLCSYLHSCSHGDKCTYIHPSDSEIERVCRNITEQRYRSRERDRSRERSRSRERDRRKVRSSERDRSRERYRPKDRSSEKYHSEQNVKKRNRLDAYDPGAPRDPRDVYDPRAPRDPRDTYDPRAPRYPMDTYDQSVHQPIIYNTIPQNLKIIPYDPASPPYPPPSPISTKYSLFLGCNCYYSNTRLRWYYQDKSGNSRWCTTDVNNELNSS